MLMVICGLRKTSRIAADTDHVSRRSIVIRDQPRFRGKGSRTNRMRLRLPLGLCGQRSEMTGFGWKSPIRPLRDHLAHPPVPRVPGKLSRAIRARTACRRLNEESGFEG